MNKEEIISNFLSVVGQFNQLLLVTDEEVERLFGEEVVAALAEMERFNWKERVCLQCGGSCCHDIGCELYLPQFGRCPIHDFRPIACRLHFCHHFDAVEKSLVLELRDVFLGIFTYDESHDSVISRLLDTPPLARSSAEFVAATSPGVEAVRQGILEPERGEKLIQQEAEKYHRAHQSRRKPADSIKSG